MDCFPDYCLACDKQIVDGLYCSQACRLTDLERAGSPSTPTSPPTSGPFSIVSASSMATTHNRLSTYNLTDAFKSTSSTSRPRSSSSTSLNSFSRTPPSPRRPALPHTFSAPATPAHTLSPSSSRSSLASGVSGLQPYRGSDGISQEAKNELKCYFDALDHTRERRRRSYPSYAQYVHDSTGMTPLRAYDDE